MEPSTNKESDKTEVDDLLEISPEDMNTESPDDKQFKEDSQTLMNLVPEEIWLKIFSSNFQGTAQEFIHMINSSPVFRSLFSSQRTFYLFQNVFPFLQPYLSSTSSNILLTLRLICSSWSSTVDSFIHQKSIQNFTHPTLHEPFEKPDAIQSSSTHTFPSNHFTKLNAFLDYFSTTHPIPPNPTTSPRNPFIGTTLNIPIIHGTPNPDLFYIAMNYCLHLYGRHIIQSKIPIDIDPAFSPQCIFWVLNWLSSLSHLEQLHIQVKNFRHGIQDFDDLINRRPLYSRFLDQPDVLQHLKVLRLDATANTLFRSVAQKSAENLKILRLIHLNNKFDYKILRIQFPNLEILEMAILTKRGVVSLVEAKEKFTRQPKLELLNFKCVPMQFVRWSTVFKALDMKLNGKLKKVVLKLPHAVNKEHKEVILEDSKLKRIGLLGVRCLEIEIWNRCHLNFLLVLKKSLEELRVTFQCPVYPGGRDDEERVIGEEGVKRRRKIEFFGWEDDMGRSNIWGIFTRLEKLVIWRNGKEEIWYRKDLQKYKEDFDVELDTE